ncbi:MAG TPA: UPF0182 family protein [Vicinamibacterales bacterium]
MRRWILFAIVAIVFIGGGTVLSYYVDALWWDALGFGDVFWKTLRLQSLIFTLFAVVTFLVLYGCFTALKPPRIGELRGVPILINGQPIRLPVEPVLRLIGVAGAAVIAAATAAGMVSDWTTLVLYWSGAGNGTNAGVDPIFQKPIEFYLFTLPAYQMVSGWLISMAVVVTAVAGFFALVTSGSRMVNRFDRDSHSYRAWRGLSIAFAALLLALAWRIYLMRFEYLLTDHTIFAGVTYTEAHVTLPGLLFVVGALVLGGAAALVNAVAAPKIRWLIAAVVPAALCYAVVGVSSSYTNAFIVKPNELVRETPFIAHNIEMTRRAFALQQAALKPFPAEAGIAAVDAPNNQATLNNIRLWDWRALQDTLRQIQEIRTYYDFPDIDIDRYEIDGVPRQMMLAARELNVTRLPESSRNWINEKLIYTHGYGVTMNPVNGFTPEGMPDLVLSNMPVQSTLQSIRVTRPEIYFGELTDTDVYVKTRQKEFNYPQGDTNNLTSYAGNGGFAVGGFLRRAIIALDRGDLTKLPFSDDVTAESRVLMRRNIRTRVETLTPYLVYDQDPYIVISDEGRLLWVLDGYTMSDSFPYARHYRLNNDRINYLRNSIKAVVDAYDGTTTFYVFDDEDPIIGAYRSVFPSLFKDGASMPPWLRKHMRYPELLLQVQGAVYGLYHMTNPAVFYNREDLWSVAAEIGSNAQRDQSGAQAMEPNFVLMTLPGEKQLEFVEILPFTPANRNNLIGWIAGRSDGPNYGSVAVYEFPKTRLVDGPLQVEARIDQNPQLSSQLSLWNQQGSHVRRGSLIVIPVGQALLYAEAIYLQAERSPMPELRIVVLALQDRLAYGPTFDAALSSLFGEAASTLSPQPAATQRGAPAAAAPAQGAQGAAATSSPDLSALIEQASRDLADYQRLTAEGRLAEAGAKLEAVKRSLDELQKRRR